MLLVFGGSQGARSVNAAVAAALPGLAAPGSPSCTRTARAGTPGREAPGYVALPYIDDMPLAYAAADAVLAGPAR